MPEGKVEPLALELDHLLLQGKAAELLDSAVGVLVLYMFSHGYLSFPSSEFSYSELAVCRPRPPPQISHIVGSVSSPSSDRVPPHRWAGAQGSATTCPPHHIALELPGAGELLPLPPRHA